jgi:hypothetical protein
VPGIGSASVSMSRVALRVTLVEVRLVPSGLMSASEVVPGMVFALKLRLTRWPKLPLKVRRAFCPGAVVVTPNAAPPGSIAPVTSAGTS